MPKTNLERAVEWLNAPSEDTPLGLFVELAIQHLVESATEKFRLSQSRPDSSSSISAIERFEQDIHEGLSSGLSLESPLLRKEIQIFVDELLQCEVDWDEEKVAWQMEQLAADLCVYLVGTRFGRFGEQEAQWDVVLEKCVSRKIIPYLRKRFPRLSKIPRETRLWEHIEEDCLRLILETSESSFEFRSIPETVAYLGRVCTNAVNRPAGLPSAEGLGAPQGSRQDQDAEKGKNSGQEEVSEAEVDPRTSHDSEDGRPVNAEGEEGVLDWHRLLATSAKWLELAEATKATSAKDFEWLLRYWCLEAFRSPPGWPSEWLALANAGIQHRRQGRCEWQELECILNGETLTREDGRKVTLDDITTGIELPPGYSKKEATLCLVHWRMEQKSQRLSSAALRQFYTRMWRRLG